MRKAGFVFGALFAVLLTTSIVLSLTGCVTRSVQEENTAKVRLTVELNEEKELLKALETSPNKSITPAPTSFVELVSKVTLTVRNSNNQVVYEAETTEKENIVFNFEIKGLGVHYFEVNGYDSEGNIIFSGSTSKRLDPGILNDIRVSTNFRDGQIEVAVEYDEIIWERYNVTSLQIYAEPSRNWWYWWNRRDLCFWIPSDRFLTVTSSLYPGVWKVTFRTSLSAKEHNISPIEKTVETTAFVQIYPLRKTRLKFKVYFDSRIMEPSVIVINSGVELPYLPPVRKVAAVYDKTNKQLFVSFEKPDTYCGVSLFYEMADEEGNPYFVSARLNDYYTDGLIVENASETLLNSVFGIALNVSSGDKESGLVRLGKEKFDTIELKWVAKIPGLKNRLPVLALTHDNKVCVLAYTNKLYLIEDSTRWTEVTLPEGLWSESIPVVDESGTVYVNTNNSLVAVNQDGSIKWIFGAFLPGKVWTGVGKAAIGVNGDIYFVKDGILYAVSKAGQLKWTLNLLDLVQGSYSNYSPNRLAVSPNGEIYVAFGNVLFAISPEGALNWTFSISSEMYFKAPAISQSGTIYITAQNVNESVGEVYAINPRGVLEWTHKIQELAAVSPISIGSNGELYLIYKGIYSNHLLVLSLDGRILFKRKLTNIYSSGSTLYEYGVIVGAADRLYTIDKDWSYSPELHSLSTCGLRRFFASYPLEQASMLGNWYSLPVISEDGTIYYLGTADYIYALKTSYERGLGRGSWPRFAGNNRNTGRAGDY